jgi:hypothetical protein
MCGWQEVETSRIGRLKVPPQYKEKFMTAIGTDPMSTTLKRTPYYFPIGLQLSRPKPQYASPSSSCWRGMRSHIDDHPFNNFIRATGTRTMTTKA